MFFSGLHWLIEIHTQYWSLQLVNKYLFKFREWSEFNNSCATSKSLLFFCNRLEVQNALVNYLRGNASATTLF